MASHPRRAAHPPTDATGVPDFARSVDLVRGRRGAAAASIRRALAKARTAAARPDLLSAAADVFRACGEVAAARCAADDLAALASTSSSRALEAMAAHATGAVLVLEGEPAAALEVLRPAARSWRSLRMPYEGPGAVPVPGGHWVSNTVVDAQVVDQLGLERTGRSQQVTGVVGAAGRRDGPGRPVAARRRAADAR